MTRQLPKPVADNAPGSDIASRADALVARVRAVCGPYRPLERVPASMREIHELALLVGDWARAIEEKS